MKKAVLMLCIVFAASGVFAQEYGMMGDRSTSSVTYFYAQNYNSEISRDGAPSDAKPAVTTTAEEQTPAPQQTKEAAQPAQDAPIATQPADTTEPIPAAVTTAPDNSTTPDNIAIPDNATIATQDNTTEKKSSWFDSILDTDKSGHKFLVTINYSWFSPQSSDARDLLKNGYGLSVGYNINKYFGVEAGFYSKTGKKSSSLTNLTGDTISTESKVDSFDIFVMATARYSFKLWKGELIPYIGAGAGFASGTKKDETRINGGNIVNTSKNATGYSIVGRVGVRYGLGMFIIGANAQYLYNNMDYEKKYDFSAITYGIEAGLRF